LTRNFIQKCFAVEINENFMKVTKTYPIKHMMWYPKCTTTSSQTYFRFLYFLYHFVPAFFIDIVLRFKGSKYRLVSIYSKIYFQTQMLSYFAERMWKFNDDNKLKVYQLMSPEDLQLFPCHARNDEYEKMYDETLIGFSKYVFKQTEEDLLEARRKYKILYVAHHLFLAVLYCGLLFIAYHALGGYWLGMVRATGDF
jgi:alcohol-forming fatty acyl-CoA reductase